MMRHAILVTGPNCSGKSTMVQNVISSSERFQIMLKVIYADGPDKHEYFACPMDESRRRLKFLWESDVQCLVLEGTNRLALLVSELSRGPDRTRELVTLCTVVKPDVMKAMLMARCEKKGKTFRADYWDNDKLTYEGQRRLPNMLRKTRGRAKYYDIGAQYIGVERMAVDLVEEIERCLVNA